MNWQERITIDPKVLVGKPVVKGTRISVEFVIDLLGRGSTAQLILWEYHHLSPKDTQACLAYESTEDRIRMRELPKIGTPGAARSDRRNRLRGE